MFSTINIRYLSQFRRMFQEPPKPLGRWGIEKTSQSISAVNYYSNIDHCGDCFYDRKHVETIFKKKDKSPSP